MGLKDQQNISEKYLDALKSSDGWSTVSDWAIKVGELFPDILEKADREAKAHENPSTGLREIAARISSNISRGAYQGLIEIDESERPRKVRFLSETDAKNYEEKELEEDLAPISRSQKIRSDFENLSIKEKYRLDEFEAIIGQLRHFFNLDFELEHAKALLNPKEPGLHHPNNIQILLKSHNRMKSNDNWERFTINEQIDYINSAISLQKMVSKRMGVEIDDSVIDSIISRLKVIF
jgi:hypothetical protein